MIHIRGEGEPVRNGINFYPLPGLNNIGFVVKFGKFVRFVYYSRCLGKFRYYGPGKNGVMVE